MPNPIDLTFRVTRRIADGSRTNLGDHLTDEAAGFLYWKSMEEFPADDIQIETVSQEEFTTPRVLDDEAIGRLWKRP